MALRMRQTLAHFEDAFHQEAQLERSRRERLRSSAAARSRQRNVARVHKQGSMRFVLLALSLVATAVIVTVVMFETLAYVIG